jgi:hypothetical protein
MVNSDNGAILQEVINSVATVYDWKGFYEPEVKILFPLKAEQLQSYEGRYKYRATSNYMCR